MRLLGFLFVSVFLLAGCGDMESSSGTGDSTSEREDQSSLACDHFRNVASDVSQGLMTDDEMREKLKEVHDDAIIATPAVQRAATDMLAAATAGDYKQLGRAVNKMGQACSAAGH